MHRGTAHAKVRTARRLARAQDDHDPRSGPAMPLVVYFNQMKPYFSAGEEAFKACRPVVGFRLFSLVKFNEFKDRLLNTLDGIAYAAPEPASIKWTLVNRICH